MTMKTPADQALFADESGWQPVKKNPARVRKRNAAGTRWMYKDAPKEEAKSDQTAPIEQGADLGDPLHRKQLADLADERGQPVRGQSASEHRDAAVRLERQAAIRKGYQYLILFKEYNDEDGTGSVPRDRLFEKSQEAMPSLTREQFDEEIGKLKSEGHVDDRDRWEQGKGDVPHVASSRTGPLDPGRGEREKGRKQRREEEWARRDAEESGRASVTSAIEGMKGVGHRLRSNGYQSRSQIEHEVTAIHEAMKKANESIPLKDRDLDPVSTLARSVGISQEVLEKSPGGRWVGVSVGERQARVTPVEALITALDDERKKRADEQWRRDREAQDRKDSRRWWDDLF